MARVMLLLTAHTYRGEPFSEAARRLGIEIVQAIDMPRQLADYWDAPLGMDFNEPDAAVQAIVEFAAERPLAAILAVDDSGALLAARASTVLGLPHNSVAAAEAARDKYRMRQLLAQAGVASPPFRRFTAGQDVADIGAQVVEYVGYPCVVKPLTLSGSRGVIRADDEAQLAAAVTRLTRLLDSLIAPAKAKTFLVERFIPGFEVALEGLMDDGRLRLLALFDKPEPLDGPFFEETIYVTPSRLPSETQAAIVETAAQAASALGLRTGPIHAELRVNQDGPWIVEIAGRSIGGLCSRTLRFDAGDLGMSLEELILRQACGLPIDSLDREKHASGVMMIPIPAAGLLRQVEGMAEAEAVPGVEEVTITARLNYRLVPLPEGDSYLGFIFARAKTADAVEAALRQAFGHLHFKIDEEIPLAVTSKQ
ncbi:MAG TPA: ATP-grasp domain-containing protein [Anaerolineae bacterium]